MSLDAMRWAKKIRTGRSSAKAVLTWMADMCGADFTTFPSITALAEATELDKKTVQSSLQYLIAQKLIEDTGERRGRTMQIPVYRLVGVEESIADAEHTRNREHYQKRDALKSPNYGVVKGNPPKSGGVNRGQTIPFFPPNDPKNGIRNPPYEPEDLNPTHRELGNSPAEIMTSNGVPSYPDEAGFEFPAVPATGKFAMHPGWEIPPDFRKRAALWGRAVPAGMTQEELKPLLNSFIAYWQAEGKFFHQVQWEQKFAAHLQREAADRFSKRGTSHAKQESDPTANAAVQKIRAARAQREREREQGMDFLGGHGGNLFQSLDGPERVSAFGPVDSSGREPYQHPDDGDW